MTINLVSNEIRRFLCSSTPEVLCIKGPWGVGKTYSWHHFLSEAIAKNEVALDFVSYVSLFGLNSLDEVKQTIFANTKAHSEQNPASTVTLLFFLRFGVEEIVYHGDDGIAFFHQRNVCRVR